MGWTVRKRVGLELADAHQSDIPFVLAGRYLDYTEAFSAGHMVNLTKGFLRRMGGILQRHLLHRSGKAGSF